MAPPFIGLTGAIAAGKSEALAAFERQGAVTLSTDAIVHALLDSAELRDLLIERWGDEVAPGGEVDRGRVGAVVFEDPDELAWLEWVLHPRVGERVLAWRQGLDDDVPLAVVEVPLLFETGMEGVFDATVSVVAGDDARSARAGERGTDLLEGRSGRQLSEQEKAARADHVLRNEGSLDQLEAEVASLWPRLTALSRSDR